MKVFFLFSSPQLGQSCACECCGMSTMTPNEDWRKIFLQ